MNRTESDVALFTAGVAAGLVDLVTSILNTLSPVERHTLAKELEQDIKDVNEYDFSDTPAMKHGLLFVFQAALKESRMKIPDDTTPPSIWEVWEDEVRQHKRHMRRAD